jgi:hypothetical protein
VRAPSVGTRGMAMSRNGDRATATGAGSMNSPRASGAAAGDPSRFPRDVTPRSTSGWSAASPPQGPAVVRRRVRVNPRRVPRAVVLPSAVRRAAVRQAARCRARAGARDRAGLPAAARPRRPVRPAGRAAREAVASP